VTLIEAINRADALFPNAYKQSEKIYWLSTLDGIIKREIIDTYEGFEGVDFNGYNENTPLHTQLLVPAPYDEVYIRYLEMQINYTNGEFGRYNNSVEMYDEAYSAFKKYYGRTHVHRGKKFKFF
jgi:hypothetical protein